jgi:hypothetical protein
MRADNLSLTFSLVVLGTLIIGPGNAYADNWMRSEDEGYYKASLQYDTTDERWNQDSKLETMSCTPRNWLLSQSYEYGLSYYRTFFGSLDYLDRSCGANEASGIGNLTLGLRSRLDIYRNGRTWEVAAIIPTGYPTNRTATIGSGFYGLRLGVFGSFGDKHNVSGEYGSNVELGTNIYFWEGSAAEQLSGYIKYNFAATQESHFYGALEGDYAIINRSKDLTTVVNEVSDYGYDRLNARFGYSRRASLYWRFSIEGTSVLRGRNTNDSNSVTIAFSRNFLD